MAKIRNDLHPIEDWPYDWVVTGLHVVDAPNAPYRDFHTVLFAERLHYPSPLPDNWGFILVYSREQAQALAYAIAQNPMQISDMCFDCHWPYYRMSLPRWALTAQHPGPLRYLTWPDNHRGTPPACMSWDDTWQDDPYPPYPWE